MVLTKYRFNETKAYMRYRGVSGIYAFLFEDNVIYVGQSKNMRERLLKHHSINGNINKVNKDRERYPVDSQLNTLAFYNFLKEHIQEIEFIALPVEIDKLNEVEEHYINKYKPRFNYAGVVAEYKPVPRVNAPVSKVAAA